MANLIVVLLGLIASDFGIAKNRFGSPSEHIEKYEKAIDDDGKFSHLEGLSFSLGFETSSSFKASQAEKYMPLLKKLMPKHRDHWGYGNAFYNYHMVMGRVFLRKGKIDKAGEYLVKSCETPGSPQIGKRSLPLNLFKELFERGDRKWVVKFVEFCNKRGFLAADEARKWAEDIRADRFPKVNPLWLPLPSR